MGAAVVIVTLLSLRHGGLRYAGTSRYMGQHADYDSAASLDNVLNATLGVCICGAIVMFSRFLALFSLLGTILGPPLFNSQSETELYLIFHLC